MVNTLSHIGIGLLIASYLGLEGRKRKAVVFLSLLPDLDIIPNLFLMAINDSLNHSTRNQLFYLMGHREFMHSLLFISIVVIALWVWKRDRLLTIAGFGALFSHFYLDYATTWKMRPLYPFVSEPSILASMDFFDPLVTLFSFAAIIIFLIEWMGAKGIGREKIVYINSFLGSRRKGICSVMLYVLVLWCLLTPVSKAVLVEHISSVEGVDISYQNTYPESFGKFVCAYSFNSTHYRILEATYWSGITRSDHIEKISFQENPIDTYYVDRAGSLYLSSLPGEVDYPVYSVSGGNSSVTVNLSDARNPYVMYWAYFGPVYSFVFNNGDYDVYITDQSGRQVKAPGNWFE